MLAGLIVLAVGVMRWMAKQQRASRAEGWAGLAFLAPWLFPALLAWKQLTPEIDLTESGDSFTVLNGVDNLLTPLLDVN